MTSQAGAGQAGHSVCAHKARRKCVVAPGKWLHQTPSSFAARRLASCCCPATLNCRACPAAASRVPSLAAAPTARSPACAIAASVIAAELPVDPPSPSSPTRGDVRGRSVPANAAAAAPPVPPPLSQLPEPLAADAIPPLLQWAPRAQLRPVAVQLILDQHCSSAVLEVVSAAARLAETPAPEPGPAAPRLAVVTAADLAAAVLAAAHPDCAAAAGVLHHTCGMPLLQCEALLAGRAAAERDREAARRGSREVGCSSGSGTGSGGGETVAFTSGALHFLLEAYRWSVFTGFDAVQPCHLLWALAADPRTSYSRGRTDPLDGEVVAWSEWEPPLVGLLEEAAQWPAPAYEQLLGVLRRSLAAAQRLAGEPQAAWQRQRERRVGWPQPAGNGGVGGPAAAAAAVGPLRREAELLCGGDEPALALLQRLTTPADACSYLAECRGRGAVPSRRQLIALDRLLVIASASASASAPAPSSSASGGSNPDAAAVPWALVAQTLVGVAALGFQLSIEALGTLRRAAGPPPAPPPECNSHTRLLTTPSRAASVASGAAPPPQQEQQPTVPFLCELALAGRFHFSPAFEVFTPITELPWAAVAAAGSSGSSSSSTPRYSSSSYGVGAHIAVHQQGDDASAAAAQALLSVCDVMPGVNWQRVLAGALPAGWMEHVAAHVLLLRRRQRAGPEAAAEAEADDAHLAYLASLPARVFHPQAPANLWSGEDLLACLPPELFIRQRPLLPHGQHGSPLTLRQAVNLLQSCTALVEARGSSGGGRSKTDVRGSNSSSASGKGSAGASGRASGGANANDTSSSYSVAALSQLMSEATAVIAAGCSSVHASRRLQVEVAQAYREAGLPLPEGWLRLLAAYQHVGAAAATAKTMGVVLEAAAHVAEVAAARLRAPDPAAATATATATSPLPARMRVGAAAERGAAKHGGTVAAEAAEVPVTGCALLPASLLVEDLATLVSAHAQSPEGLMQLDDTRRVLGDLGRLAAAGTEGGTAAAALRPWADRLVDVCWKGWVFGWNREEWPGSEDEHGWQDEDEEARSL